MGELRSCIRKGWFLTSQCHRRFCSMQGETRTYTLPACRQHVFEAKDSIRPVGVFAHLGVQSRCLVGSKSLHSVSKYHGNLSRILCSARMLTSHSTSESSGQAKRKDISTIEDPFDAPTYNIPEKPVTFVEGTSYTLIILAGLGIAGVAIYAVCTELIIQPKEYKVFNKALVRVQDDSQVRIRIGYPITGYGHETRNRAARQRIPHRVWKDEDGIEHVEVNFHVRGPNGAGKVFGEMFKDKAEKQWRFTYLLVEITSPAHARLLLESYVPP